MYRQASSAGWKLLQTVAAAAALVVLFGPVHEKGHMIAAWALGGAGHMEYSLYPLSLADGRMVWERPIADPSLLWIVGIAGGVYSAAWLLSAVWALARLTPTAEDTYLEFAAWFVATAELMRAAQEAMGHGGPWYAAVVAVPALAGFVVALWRWGRWITRPNRKRPALRIIR